MTTTSLRERQTAQQTDVAEIKLPTLPRYPSLYQINTRVWLTELSRKLGRRATLDDIPDAELDRLAAQGFDWIWLLSVWQTGLAGQSVSRTNAVWRKEFEETLADLSDDDIGGSGFAITGYTVHADLGGDAALARLRDRLRRRGLRLMLDFVPNHTGLDHPWVEEHSGVLCQGNRAGTCSGTAELHLDQAQARGLAAGLWPRSVLSRLARCLATRLQQSGHARSDDRRVAEDCRPVRCGALRYGDARLAGRLRAHVGQGRPTVLARCHPTRAGEGPRVSLHGGGLLGPRMDDAAAGFRLRVRQTTVRPPARRSRPAGARAFSCRARLPRQTGPILGESRRAASGGCASQRHASSGGRCHISRAGLAVLPSRPVRGAQETHLAAPRPRPGGNLRPGIE